MDSSQSSLPVIQYNSVTKRAYKLRKSWDHIKPYVVSERNRGQKPKAIKAGLERQGVSISRNQLSILMDEWGLTLKHLRPRQKKHILEVEDRAQRRGKVVHGWWVIKNQANQSSRIRVTQAQLENVRQRGLQALENETSSPGTLVPSPLDILDIESPVLEDTDVPNRQLYHDAVDELVSDEEKADADSEKYVSDLREADADYVYIHGKILCDDLGDGELVRSGREESECASDGGSVVFVANQSDTAIKNEGEYSCDELPDFKDEPIEVQKLIEDLTDGIAQSIREIPEPIEVLPEHDSADELSVGEFIDNLSEKFRNDLDDWIEKNVEMAGGILQGIDGLRSLSGRSTQDCEDEILDYYKDWHWTYRKSYRQAKYIYDGGWVSFVAENSSVETAAGWAVFEQMALEFFYDTIGELWQVCGADSATFKARNGNMINSFWRGTMRNTIVHFRHLMWEYGITHWATLLALSSLTDCWREHSSYGTSEIVLVLWEYMLKIFQSFGISPIVTNISGNLINLYLRLYRFTDAHHLAADLFSSCRVRFGDSHGETLQAASALMAVLHNIPGSERGTAQLAKYLTFYSKNSSLLLYPSATGRLLLDGILYNCIDAGRVKEALDIVRTSGRSLYKAPGTTRNSVFAYIRYEYRTATAYFIQSDYTLSIQSLHNAIYRFHDIFRSTAFNVKITEFATEVMTMRGMIRYTQPYLERLVSVYEEKDNPDKHLQYTSLRIAEGSASFQLFVEHNNDEWSLPRIMAPCEEVD